MAELDKELLQTYKLALKTKGESIKINQKEWIIARDLACEGKNNEEITQILLEKYRTRVQELKK